MAPRAERSRPFVIRLQPEPTYRRRPDTLRFGRPSWRTSSRRRELGPAELSGYRIATCESVAPPRPGAACTRLGVAGPGVRQSRSRVSRVRVVRQRPRTNGAC